MIRFASLGSGSKGNATLVEAGGTRLLIDCGFTLRETTARLRRLGVEPQSIAAILVTHEHNDHLGGVAVFARRHGTPVWITHGSHQAWSDPDVPCVQRFSPHQGFRIGALEVTPYPVPHDAREPCQYRLGDGRLSLGILSDAGHVTPHMKQVLARCDGLMLECNHDTRMLGEGPYPPALKRRVGSALGHLSNAQAAELLRAVEAERLQQLVLTHLSEVNNTPALARAAAVEALDRDEPWIRCAGQADGLGWTELR